MTTLDTIDYPAWAALGFPNITITLDGVEVENIVCANAIEGFVNIHYPQSNSHSVKVGVVVITHDGTTNDFPELQDTDCVNYNYDVIDRDGEL